MRLRRRVVVAHGPLVSDIHLIEDSDPVIRRFRGGGRETGVSLGVAAFGATHRRTPSPLCREAFAKRRLEDSIGKHVRDAADSPKPSHEILDLAPECQRGGTRLWISPLRHPDPVGRATCGELDVLRRPARRCRVCIRRKTIRSDDFKLELHATREESSGKQRTLVEVRIRFRQWRCCTLE